MEFAVEGVVCVLSFTFRKTLFLLLIVSI